VSYDGEDAECDRCVKCGGERRLGPSGIIAAGWLAVWAGRRKLRERRGRLLQLRAKEISDIGPLELCHPPQCDIQEPLEVTFKRPWEFGPGTPAINSHGLPMGDEVMLVYPFRDTGVRESYGVCVRYACIRMICCWCFLILLCCLRRHRSAR
jgi:hypothetical protein